VSDNASGLAVAEKANGFREEWREAVKSCADDLVARRETGRAFARFVTKPDRRNRQVKPRRTPKAERHGFDEVESRTGERRMCLALPAKIVTFPPDEPGIAVVDVLSVERRVNVDLLRNENLAVGDWILLHVGFAMSKVSEKDAQEQIELLMMLGETCEAERQVAL